MLDFVFSLGLTESAFSRCPEFILSSCVVIILEAEVPWW